MFEELQGFYKYEKHYIANRLFWPQKPNLIKPFGSSNFRKTEDLELHGLFVTFTTSLWVKMWNCKIYLYVLEEAFIEFSQTLKGMLGSAWDKD